MAKMVTVVHFCAEPHVKSDPRGLIAEADSLAGLRIAQGRLAPQLLEALRQMMWERDMLLQMRGEQPPA